MINIKKALEHATAYQAFFFLVGGNNVYHTLINRYIRPQAGCNLLDIGCGPGHFLPWLKDVTYTGIDMSERYIADARATFGARGQFICGDVGSVDIPSAPYDIVVASGLLHHLSDTEVSQLARRVRQLLKPGGRLLTVDPCYTAEQSKIAHYIISHDRGHFVRDAAGYTELVIPYFTSVNTSLRHDLLRIPYTHLIMECMA